MNYSPNFLGRNLRKAETNTILVIQPSTEHSLYSEIMRGMQLKAFELGYDIISSNSNSTSEIEIRQMNMLFNRTVDGAVLMGTQYSATMLNELADKYNIALCCEGVAGANVLTVTVDDEQAGYDAGRALLAKGHKRLAIVSTLPYAQSSVKRETGFLKALNEAGLPTDERYIYRGSYDYRNGTIALDRFLLLEEPPTAIFCVSDLLAAGVIHRAVDKGLAVGKDLAIMGFDNITMCHMYSPSISTVAQPCEKMGAMVIEKLIDNITTKREKDNKSYFIPHDVILRQSTGD
ncbi:MAG: LacI family DNA-binding transcriptional regulator [Oscillospiraceae bacterium]